MPSASWRYLNPSGAASPIAARSGATSVSRADSWAPTVLSDMFFQKAGVKMAAAAAWSGAWAPAVIDGEAPAGRRKQIPSSAWMHGASPSMLKWNGRFPARCVDSGSRPARFTGIAYAMDASFGGAGEFSGSAPIFPRIDVRDPYRRLGISREASEEEVREARNYLLKQYGAHSKSKGAIESAYDKIILDSLKQRRRPKPKRISERPAWVRKVYERFDAPPTIVIAARAFAFFLLGVWSVFDSATEGPVIQVILSLAACIYFLKKRFKALWKASLIGIGTFIFAWVLGSFLVPALPTMIFPGSWNIELMSSLISYVVLWLSCTFLK